MKKNTLLVGLLLIIGISAHAQSRFNMNFHLAPSMGAFKSGIYDDFSNWGSVTLDDPNGFAGTGIGIGLDYHHPFKEKGLELLVGIDVYRTPIRRIIRKSFKNYVIEDKNDKSIKFSSYYNITPKLGLQYGVPLKEGIELFGQAFAVYDILKITRSEYQYNIVSGSSPTVKSYDFKLSGAFGFEMRLGIAINDTYTLSLAYKHLGKHLITRTLHETYPWTSQSNQGENQKNISMLNFSVGILF